MKRKKERKARVEGVRKSEEHWKEKGVKNCSSVRGKRSHFDSTIAHYGCSNVICDTLSTRRHLSLKSVQEFSRWIRLVSLQNSGLFAILALGARARETQSRGESFSFLFFSSFLHCGTSALIAVQVKCMFPFFRLLYFTFLGKLSSQFTVISTKLTKVKENL